MCYIECCYFRVYWVSGSVLMVVQRKRKITPCRHRWSDISDQHGVAHGNKVTGSLKRSRLRERIRQSFGKQQSRQRFPGVVLLHTNT